MFYEKKERDECDLKRGDTVLVIPDAVFPCMCEEKCNTTTSTRSGADCVIVGDVDYVMPSGCVRLMTEHEYPFTVLQKVDYQLILEIENYYPLIIDYPETMSEKIKEIFFSVLDLWDFKNIPTHFASLYREKTIPFELKRKLNSSFSFVGWKNTTEFFARDHDYYKIIDVETFRSKNATRHSDLFKEANQLEGTMVENFDKKKLFEIAFTYWRELPSHILAAFVERVKGEKIYDV